MRKLTLCGALCLGPLACGEAPSAAPLHAPAAQALPLVAAGPAGVAQVREGDRVIDWREHDGPYLRPPTSSAACAAGFARIDAAWGTFLGSPEARTVVDSAVATRLQAAVAAFRGPCGAPSPAMEATCRALGAEVEAAKAAFFESPEYAAVQARPELGIIAAGIDAAVADACYVDDPEAEAGLGCAVEALDPGPPDEGDEDDDGP